MRSITSTSATSSSEKQADEAIAAYRKAIELDPRDPNAHNNLGNALSAGKLDEAIAALPQGHRTRPEPRLHGNLGDALQPEKRKLDEAIAYRKAIGLEPKTLKPTSPRHRPGEQRKLDEAIAAFRKASDSTRTRQRPQQPRRRPGDQGRMDEAIASFKEALRLEPDNALTRQEPRGPPRTRAAWMKRSRCTGRIRRKQTPSRPTTCSASAEKKGKPERGHRRYRKAIRLQPDYYRELHELGIALGKQGKLNQAIACNQEAIRLQPDLPAAQQPLRPAVHQPGHQDS